MLTANLDSASLEQIALLDTKEQQQRQQAKNLIEQADPDQETNDKDYASIPSSWGIYPKAIGLLLARFSPPP